MVVVAHTSNSGSPVDMGTQQSANNLNHLNLGLKLKDKNCNLQYPRVEYTKVVKEFKRVDIAILITREKKKE